MDRFRRSVKLPITITHSRPHHRAVNKIISTTLGGWIIAIGRPGAARSRREYVARRRLTTAIRKRPRRRLIARPPLWFSMRKNALRDESLISKPAFLDWHFTTVPRRREFDVRIFQFHAAHFPRWTRGGRVYFYDQNLSGPDVIDWSKLQSWR